MIVGLLAFDIRLPGCDNLKEKRHRLKGVIEKVRSKFNVSATEVALLDSHQNAEVAIAMVSNDRIVIEKAFSKVEEYFANGDGLLITGCATEWF